MKEKLKDLATAMSVLQDQQDELKARKEAFEQENKDLLKCIADRKAYIDRLKKDLEPEAIDQFKETGRKKLTGGVGIREVKAISYSASEAFKWAKEKDIFLTLDTKAFEKAAPSLDLDFVTLGTVTKVTFPNLERLRKELSK